MSGLLSALVRKKRSLVNPIYFHFIDKSHIIKGKVESYISPTSEVAVLSINIFSNLHFTNVDCDCLQHKDEIADVEG